jgi:uncharacterized damage-inducible protein DinB
MIPELENYHERIKNLRDQVIDLIAALPAEALNWRPIEAVEDHAMNSLAIMAAHVAGSEHFWIAEVIGGYPATRNREAEFVTEVTDSAELRQRLEKAGAETRKVLSRLPAAELESTREARGRTIPVRWALVHVIDHTALHLGHMQITYQLWQGGRSIKSPRWFERLPRSQD